MNTTWRSATSAPARSMDFLTQMGIPNNQLTIISYGKQRPVCTDTGENCWQMNRRSHVTAERYRDQIVRGSFLL